MIIDAMTADDWPSVSSIYAAGIASGNATFETVVPSWEKWDASHVPSPRLVARDESGILGWAALSRVSSRPVYSGVGEVSIYIAESARGRGVGTALMKQLIAESESAGFWTLQASVFPENEASVRLHERHGFRVVGRRERIAQQNGRWRDTVLLERRC
jgi:L-amino acid N-acyltransferase YncA